MNPKITINWTDLIGEHDKQWKLIKSIWMWINPIIISYLDNGEKHKEKKTKKNIK